MAVGRERVSGTHQPEMKQNRELQLLINTQAQENRPIHKGGTYYSLGWSLLGQGNRIKDAVHSFLLAYVEDTLNVPYDMEDEADRAPAAITLKDIVRIRLRILREIKSVSAQKKIANIWNDQRDPDTLLSEALQNLGIDKTEFYREFEATVKLKGKQPLGFPQPWAERVFIGTNYDTFAHIIPEIKEAVIQSNYTPVVAAEVDMSEEEIHHHSLMLLHTCKFAVFDVTNPAGQYMEIERLKDYEIASLLVRSARDGNAKLPHWLSRMIETAGYSVELYKDIPHLKEIVTSFLSLLFSGKNVELIENNYSGLGPTQFQVKVTPQKLRRGETVTTSVHFKGTLTNGFFDNKICFPDKREGWNWDLGTLSDVDANTPGKLNGNIEVKSKWEWTIPKWAPPGEYTIIVRAYNHFGLGKRKDVIEQKKKILVL